MDSKKCIPADCLVLNDCITSTESSHCLCSLVQKINQSQQWDTDQVCVTTLHGEDKAFNMIKPSNASKNR